MNNEDKILAILTQMQSDISQIKEEQVAIKHEQVEIRQEQGQLKQGQIDLKAYMDKRFSDLEYNLNAAWNDIGIVEKRILQHEKEFHSV